MQRPCRESVVSAESGGECCAVQCSAVQCSAVKWVYGVIQVYRVREREKGETERTYQYQSDIERNKLHKKPGQTDNAKGSVQS